MGRRFKIYVDQADIGDICGAVTGWGGLIVGVKSEEPRLRILDREDVASEVIVLIVPPAYRETLVPRPTASGRRHVLDAVVDPVMEFVPSRHKDGLLTPGRFYFVAEYVVDGAFVAKPDVVRQFADEVFAWARRWSRRAGGKACGPSTAAAVRDGRVELAP